MIDGSEVLTLSLLIPFLEDQWSLSTNDKVYLATSVFAGMFIGSLISGYISDKYGRRNPSFIIVFLMFVFSLLSAFATNIV